LHNEQSIYNFFGVGGHHQNDIAECKIKELTLGARTLLLCSKRVHPEYILMILWTFALKCAEDRLNNLVHQADERTPYQTIASHEASKIKLSDFHMFGSPCCVLDARLQSGLKTIPKWEPWAWMGIYVG
jgi:hypothetical protein